MGIDWLEVDDDPEHTREGKAQAKETTVGGALAHVSICNGVVEHLRSYGGPRVEPSTKTRAPGSRVRALKTHLSGEYYSAAASGAASGVTSGAASSAGAGASSTAGAGSSTTTGAFAASARALSRSARRFLRRS